VIRNPVIRALLFARHVAKLIAEEYVMDFTREERHQLQAAKNGIKVAANIEKE